MRFLPRRGTAIGAVAAISAAGLIAPALMTGSAGASVTGPAPGGVRCTGVSGTITFNPPLNGGTSNTMTETTSLTLTHCSVTQASSAPSQGTLTGSRTVTSTDNSANSCAGLQKSAPSHFRIKWTATPPIWGTRVTFSGYTVKVNSAGDVGLGLPGPKGWSRVAGSFKGTQQGKHSHAVFFTSNTINDLLAACGSSGGLSGLNITSGKITLT